MPTSIDELRAYLDTSPSPYHAVASTAERLDSDGFVELELDASWSSLPASGYVRRDGAIIAWRQPVDAPPSTPFVIAGAHTDSPNLRVNPRPQRTEFGWDLLTVEVYGGILNNTWLDRDLGIAGRVIDVDGTSALVDVDRPIARVPQLAVHLDRGVNDDGLKLNRHQHLRPVWATAGNAPRFADWLGDQAGIGTAAYWDIGLYDVQPAALLGVDESLLASGRLDNLLSCWASLDALIGCEPTDQIALIVLNDHEEVGSSSVTGAGGPLLETVLERHVLGRGGNRAELLATLASSMCLSIDNAHAIHPNYPERHDEQHAPLVNRGPAIKINANQRYATSVTTAARFAAACESVDVPTQRFVSRSDMPCGSTIGPITATRLGIDTCDVGVPQLSMHSARELCGADDALGLATAVRSFFDHG